MLFSAVVAVCHAGYIGLDATSSQTVVRHDELGEQYGHIAVGAPIYEQNYETGDGYYGQHDDAYSTGIQDYAGYQPLATYAAGYKNYVSIASSIRKFVSACVCWYDFTRAR